MQNKEFKLPKILIRISQVGTLFDNSSNHSNLEVEKWLENSMFNMIFLPRTVPSTIRQYTGYLTRRSAGEKARMCDCLSGRVRSCFGCSYGPLEIAFLKMSENMKMQF